MNRDIIDMTGTFYTYTLYSRHARGHFIHIDMHVDILYIYVDMHVDILFI